ncbi:hypothetical protein CJF42_19465 [Pseudoalteromonas sp. NBT06-2]|uniref:M23 family metallopeptidase n=1 Tax=Pseudoalteromonas sp. NBT06-2 TaxID=2025950 RepID=UPI000BA4F19B|nr:M23 family metallopeptidase [Pseudoalteromonas sp. NBT06-2]PAJ72783.1 hypothetical protein CJF42_19465 [Pseudoalteromonas sp. NBT06-2]
MLDWLKNTQKKHLPERQLLIRQNGEVKYVNITGLVQLSLLGLTTLVLIWIIFSSTKYFTLTKKISTTHYNLQQSQQHLDHLKNEYKQKHHALNEELSQLQQQQLFLQNILDSLPQAINTDNDKSKISSKSQNQTSEPSNTNTYLLNEMDISKNTLAAIKLKQDSIFIQLANQMQKRKSILDNALNSTGITNKMINENFAINTYAQGGPLYDLSTRATDKQKDIIDQLIELKELETALKNIPVKLPAKNYYISSLYGYRKDPISKRRSMHKGIDMAGWIKTQIFAPASGKVKRAGKNGSYGNFIEIDHLNGFTTRYGHLHKIKVKKGQAITKNDVIGLMGSTGRSTSTHLHYEVMFNKKSINPLRIKKALENVL